GGEGRAWGGVVLRDGCGQWRGSLAVFFGGVVGTAVLTGALLVGDSLRGSLRQLMLQQLGNVDHVLIANRLIRQDLAQELTSDRAARRVSPVLILQGAITRDEEAPDSDQETKPGPRAGRVNILGVNESFWHLWPEGEPPLD